MEDDIEKIRVSVLFVCFCVVGAIIFLMTDVFVRGLLFAADHPCVLVRQATITGVRKRKEDGMLVPILVC